MDTETRHVHRGKVTYWCGVEARSGDLTVTETGAFLRLQRDEGGVCEACLRAMTGFIGESIDDVPAEQPAEAVNMTDNLARVSLMRMAESIAVPLRDLWAELNKQLSDISWRELHRGCGRAELAIRDFRDVIQICSVIYGADDKSETN